MEFAVDEDVQKSKVRRPDGPGGFPLVQLTLAVCFPQVVYASKDPSWEEGFTFFVNNVQTQQLSVQVGNDWYR